MVTVTIRFYGLIRLLKKLTVTTSIRSEADRAVKTDCEVNAVVSGGTQPHLKKNLVTRQTMNCPNTQKRKVVYYDNRKKQSVHRKVVGYKESFGVFRFTYLHPQESILFFTTKRTCTY